jgi:1,4-dihydroxy-2-naphthoyl-CoA hydrolase
MSDTDTAGLLYFANQLIYAHDAYELVLKTIGFPMVEIVDKLPFLLPIVHAEADYLRSLAVGDELEVSVRVAKIGRTSFTLAYELSRSGTELVGRAKTVHVSVDKESRRKVELPAQLRQALEHLQGQP